MRALSATLALGHLCFVPAFLLFPVTQVVPGRVSIVASLNPVWPWVFALSGLWLLAAVWKRPRWLWLGHAMAGTSFALMGVASLMGALILPAVGAGEFANPALGISGSLLAFVHGYLAGWAAGRRQ